MHSNGERVGPSSIIQLSVRYYTTEVVLVQDDDNIFNEVFLITVPVLEFHTVLY